MLKKGMVINWLLFSGAFLLGEFFAINQSYYWPTLIFLVWFGLAEGWQVAAGVESEASEKDDGGTFSAFGWAWIEAGVKAGRFAMIWLFCVALMFRLAVVSAEFDGYLVPGELPYILSQGPILIVLTGVAIWLLYHFWSLGRYGNGNGK